MNKGLILSFLVFFLTTTLHSQTIDLFQLINTIDWHSTETDLIRNYPDDIQKQSHYSNNREQTMTDYIFDSVSIGKYVCKTDIWVDSLTKNLYSLKSYVSNCVDKSIEAEVLSNEMDRLLISVFGEPDVIDNDYGTYMSHLDRRWFKEKYIVDVNHMVFSTSQIYVLTIEKNKAEGNDFRVAKWGESKESVMRKEGKRDKANIAEIYLEQCGCKGRNGKAGGEIGKYGVHAKLRIGNVKTCQFADHAQAPCDQDAPENVAFDCLDHQDTGT